MKKIILFGFYMAICSLVMSQNLPKYALGQLIVKVKDNSSLYKACKKHLNVVSKESRKGSVEEDSAFKKLGVYNLEFLHYIDKEKDFLKSGAERLFVFYTYEKDVVEMVKKIKKMSDIEEAYPNYLFVSHAVPNDDKYSNQWSLSKINMSDAWNIQKGCVDVKIAVLDAGFRDLGHDDVDGKFLSTRRDETDIDVDSYTNAGYVFLSGEDYTTTDNNPEGESFHGLQVTGVVAAETNNSKGIAGIAWNNYIVPVRCGFTIKYDGIEYGIFEMDDIIRAIDWVVVGKKVHVINMSFGQAFAPEGEMFVEIENSLEAAFDAGIVVVASSGNYPDSGGFINHVCYPASSRYVIGVGASNESDNRASFSHYGADLDVVAPGVNILTVNRELINQYTEVDGTSFSAPIVSGIAALILSQNPELTPDQVREIIRASCDKVSGMNGKDFHEEYGFGRVNAKRALEFVPEIKYDVVLDDEVVTNMHVVYAQNSITVSNYFVEPGASVIFKAADNISLNNEFYIKKGADFCAYIDDVGASCSYKATAYSQSNLAQVVVDDVDSNQVFLVDKYLDANIEVREEAIVEDNAMRTVVYPNPFSASATIEFEVKGKIKYVDVFITDLIGRTVKKIYQSENIQDGVYSVEFNLGDFKHGLYFLNLETDKQKFTRKIIYQN